ncbi:hypothetical protein EGT74_16090 [Chitinophaga lutea]|uniref:Type II toxin-antitoxin system RelE/ParE family toxin n=1 Tax=Chitinophaga lutea TaxID=2488634 RepID=A0A3N4PU56_9BACT|nr:hypothetical protein EGT74_16090 [Chitinophaga lutea]
MPDSYRTTYKTYRDIYLKRYPYTIVYEVHESSKSVSITNVYHRKRNPKGRYADETDRL